MWISRRGMGGNTRPYLDRAAGRAALARRRDTMDAVRAPAALARQRHRKWRRAQRHVRRRGKARVGAPVSPRHHGDEQQRRDGPVVERSRQALRRQVLTQAAQDQDESVRSGETRLDHRRPAPYDLQVHLRWEAGAVVGHEGAARPRRRQAVRSPDDIAWLPDGTFFISDGYGGTRVAKFDKDGKFLMDWGTP